MNELESLAAFQDILLRLNSETFETTLKYLNNSYFNSFNKFNLLFNMILGIAHKNRNLRQNLTLLCKNFSDLRRKSKKHNDFKHFILSKFLKFENFDLSFIHSHIHFYFLCVQEQFLTEEDILNQMQSSINSEVAVNSPCIVYFILLYFSPLLKAKKNEFYFWLCGQFEHNIKKVSEFSKSLLRHWGHLPERLSFITSFIIENCEKIIEKENWPEREIVIKTGVLLNSVESILINDDVDKLQELVGNGLIDVDNFKCHDSFLVFQEFFDSNEIFLLQFAAVFNAVNCFKFLILNTNKPESFYNSNENNLMRFAVKGGNPEIIRILHQKKFSLNEGLSLSFLFFHFNLFQWIWQMKKEEDIESLELIVENEPLLSFSLSSLIFLCEKENENEELKNLIQKKILSETNTT